MPEQTFVGKQRPLSNQCFHARMLAGLSRAAVTLGGKGALADAMDLSGTAVDKIFAGGSTNPKRLFDLLAHEPTVLDEVVDAYGARLVDKEAVCDTDDASLLIARLLVKLQEATHPDSPGGRQIVHTELLDMEGLVRELHGATGNWLHQIAEMRRPRSVA